MRICAPVLFSILIISLGCIAATPPFVTLAWDPSPDTNVTGYNIYAGTNSRAYIRVFDAGTNLTKTVPIWARTNYFAATAYDGWGLESDFSPECVWKPDAAYWSNWFNRYPVVLTISSDGRGPLTTATNILGPWSPAEPVSLTNTWRLPEVMRFWRNATSHTTRY